MIAVLTWMNTRGLKLGKLVQNTFTFAKTGSLDRADLLGSSSASSGTRRLRPRTLAICGPSAALCRMSDLGFAPDRDHCVRVVCRYLRCPDKLPLLGRCVEQHYIYRRRGPRPETQYSALARLWHRSRHHALPVCQYRVSRNAQIRGDTDRAVRSRCVGHRGGDLSRLGSGHYGRCVHHLDLWVQQRAYPLGCRAPTTRWQRTGCSSNRPASSTNFTCRRGVSLSRAFGPHSMSCRERSRQTAHTAISTATC